MLRYTQALLTRMSQTTVCNRHHNLHQQFCRWLLLSLDRLPGNELAMTQEPVVRTECERLILRSWSAPRASSGTPGPGASSRSPASRTGVGRAPTESDVGFRPDVNEPMDNQIGCNRPGVS